LALLVPQFVLILAILVLSFFPKLLMDPVSAAIDPISPRRWSGRACRWRPAWRSRRRCLFLLIYATGRGRSIPFSIAHFYAFYRSAFTALATPPANFVWDGLCDLTVGAAELVRRVYTGNGQTYALHILLLPYICWARPSHSLACGRCSH
jgi:hypothetical protein